MEKTKPLKELKEVKAVVTPKPIELDLDLKNNNRHVIKLMQGYNYSLKCNIFDDNDALNVEGATVQVHFRKADDKYIIQSGNTWISGNTITTVLDKDFTRVYGSSKLQVVLSSGGKIFGSWVIDTIIEEGAIQEGDIESEDKITILEDVQNAITEVQNTIEESKEAKKDLDQSIEAGELENYVRTFNTFEEMQQASETLKDGQVVKTKCSNTKNDLIGKEYIKNSKGTFLNLDNFNDIYIPLTTNKGLTQLEFKRKHSVNLYKNLKYPICRMDFYRDFLGSENSNMYPNIDEKNGNDLVETIKNNCYKLENNTPGARNPQVRRFMGAHNLFSTYDISIKDITYGRKSGTPGVDFNGVRCGIDIVNPIASDNDRYNIHWAFTGSAEEEGQGGKAILRYEMFVNGISQGIQDAYTIDEFKKTDFRTLMTFKEDKIEVYTVENDVKSFVATVPLPKKLNTIERMTRCRTTLFTRLENGDKVTYTNVESYFDSGISQGDMKPIKYKTGAPLIKNGRIYYTMSSRFQSGAYQTVISQNLSGCDYKLEGVLYYIVDDTVGQDLAASILYDYCTGKFLIWNTCFSNGNHGLSYGESYSDLTSGINFIDMTLMEKGLVADTDFAYKQNDEDPDFCFNEETGKWNLIICREIQDPEFGGMYRYFLFEGDNPFTGYVYKDKTTSGTNTGGTIVKVGGKYWLCCGSNYHKKAQYNVYDLNDLSTFKGLIKDVDDGGFRGWGTIIPIPCGNYTKYGWITFDRDQAGEGRWSYGNVYYYESNIMNKGTEYKVKHNI